MQMLFFFEIKLDAKLYMQSRKEEEGKVEQKGSKKRAAINDKRGKKGERTTVKKTAKK